MSSPPAAELHDRVPERRDSPQQLWLTPQTGTAKATTHAEPRPQRACRPLSPHQIAIMHHITACGARPVVAHRRNRVAAPVTCACVASTIVCWPSHRPCQCSPSRCETLHAPLTPTRNCGCRCQHRRHGPDLVHAGVRDRGRVVARHHGHRVTAVLVHRCPPPSFSSLRLSPVTIHSVSLQTGASLLWTCQGASGASCRARSRRWRSVPYGCVRAATPSAAYIGEIHLGLGLVAACPASPSSRTPHHDAATCNHALCSCLTVPLPGCRRLHPAAGRVRRAGVAAADGHLRRLHPPDRPHHALLPRVAALAAGQGAPPGLPQPALTACMQLQPAPDLT